MSNINTAIIGLKSNIPVDGIILRIGASMGSVIWYKAALNGPVLFGATQERIARPSIAILSTTTSI